MVLSAWSWRKTADLSIDFGRELYVSWQLAEGQVLYRDIAALKGPLSAYVNALVFWVFGPSATVLLVFNLSLTAGLSYLLYDFFARTVDRSAALLVSLSFLSIFAFEHSGMVGNFNFISPYSHEATHGTLLVITILWALMRWLESGKGRFCALAGLCLGATPLTKLEIAITTGAAILVGLVALHLRPVPGRSSIRTVLIAGALVPLPMLCFFLFFCLDLPAAEAAAAVAGAWIPLYAEVNNQYYYLRVTGFDQPWGNLWAVVKSLVAIATCCTAAIWLDRFPLSNRRQNMILILIVIALSAIVLTDEPKIPRSIPVLAAMMGAALATFLWRSQPAPELSRRVVPLLLWATVSLLFLSKIVLNSSQYGYGFYLAMPAFLLFVVFLMRLIPHQLRVKKSHGEGKVFRRIFIPALTLLAIVLLQDYNDYYSRKIYTVGTGGDALRTFDTHSPDESGRYLAYRVEGPAFARVLERIEALIPKDATFVAVPEGAMLNYMARRVNPTPYLSFFPPEMAVWGEDNVLAALEAHPPDFILATERTATEYDSSRFGERPEFGANIMRWVNANYVPMEAVKQQPPVDIYFGATFMKPRD